MNFTFPSLEHIALVKVAVTFWNQDDIRDEIVEYFEFVRGNKLNEEYKWSGIELTIKERVLGLSLPMRIETDLISYVRPIGHLIRDWIERFEVYIFRESWDIQAILLNNFCWTPQGTIDQRKMAEELIKDERLTFTTRYKLACNFCLETDILMLRDKIPEDDRMDVYSEIYPRFAHSTDFTVVWNYDLTGNIANERRRNWPSRYRRAFECAASHGNKAATEYFLQKLTNAEREEYLVGVANRIVDDDDLPALSLFEIFCYLLSQMNEEQQREAFSSFPCQDWIFDCKNWFLMSILM